MKKVALITVNWNGVKDTVELFDSLHELIIPTEHKLEFIIVDNGSTDNSVDIIKSTMPNAVLLTLPENMGFTGGFNHGIDYALDNEFDYLFLLNNDTILEDKNILAKLLSILVSDEKIALVSPKIHFAPSFEYHKLNYSNEDIGKVIWYAGGIVDWKNMIVKHRGVDEVDKGQYDSIEETAYGTGCVALLKADLIRQVGLFNKDYFAYYEDFELNHRILLNNFKVMYAGNTSIWHKTSQSSEGSGSRFHDYFLTRNRLLFGMKYAPIRTRFALFKESLRFLFIGRKYQKKALVDYYIGRLGKGSF